MLSRQIASKLRGYETPFYLYDMALLRQTLESVVYESKKYGYKVHYAIKANYDDHLLAIIREDVRTQHDGGLTGAGGQ